MSETPSGSGKPTPWIAGIVVAGVGCVVLCVMALSAIVGWFVFMKPVNRPAAPMPQPGMAPVPQPSAPKEASPPAAVSAADAVAAVKARPEVAEWLANVTQAGGSPRIEVDSEDAEAYTVHVFEVVAGEGDMPGHTATLGWYTVNKATGEVTQDLP
jgi:hypothetical protein